MEQNLSQPKKERNTGLDALKLFSMFLIVLLHVLGQGGVLAACPAGSWRGETAWLLEIAGYCSVDCFALATGYVMAGRAVQYRRILGLWLQAAFWGVVLTAAFALAQPGSVGLADWLCALFPVVTKQYWYFTCYFALFFFMPALGRLLEALSETAARRLVRTLAALFTLLPCLLVFRVLVPELPHPDLFVTNNGYSLVWLAALWLIGAYCKKYHLALQRRRRTFALWCLGALAATWLSRFGLEHLTLRLWGAPMEEDFFIRYTSPTILLASVSLLLLFARLRLRGFWERAVRLLAPAAFGVYLIHAQPLVWERLLKGRFAALAGRSAPLLALLTLASALAIFLVCLLLDELRRALFRLLGTERLCARAAERFQKKADEAGF